jgi:hypothetical protein
MFSFAQYLIEDQEKKLKAKLEFMKAHAAALDNSRSYNFGGKEIKITRAQNKTPDELQEGEYSFYEPSELTGTKHRGDVIVRWQGQLLPYDLKGKLDVHRASKTVKLGKHQNDYQLAADQPIKYARKSGGVKEMTPREMADLGNRFGLSSVSKKSKTQRVFPASGTEQRKAASEEVKSHIPDVLSQIGTAFAISGSRQGIAVTQHHTEKSNKKIRELANSFLGHVGYATTHEPHELRTAGSPEFKPETPERGARGTLRVGLDVNEKTQPLMQANAKRTYN